MLSKEQEQFLELVRAGLFPRTDVRILAHGIPVDWSAVYRLAEEQSVSGLVAAGIDTLPLSERPAQQVVLQFVGQTLQLEQRNKAMNAFVANLIMRLRRADIYTILVKGQGIAQCYDKPLWRACGDIDLLLSVENYNKAKVLLENVANHSECETVKNTDRMHHEYQISGWTVELHGTMHSNLSRRVDKGIDAAQRDVFYGGHVRFWMNGNTQVFLPGTDEDVIFVFTHILQHLFLEGIGLRQICDWCRLLFCCSEKLDLRLLEKRLQRMGLMSEWKILAALAVDYLGMPAETMPFYDSRFEAKGSRLMNFIMEVGNFGHNRNVEWSNPKKRRTTLIRHRISDTIKLSLVFPVDAPKFLINYAWDGVKGLLKR